MSYVIKDLLTPYNFTDANNAGRIKYIVIHYTANPRAGAYANAQYYASTYVGASAHYFVDSDNVIYRSVADEDIAWHVGAKYYVHPECRNSNSIGIEMCVKKRSLATLNASDTDWYFEDATVDHAVELTRDLMKKYGVPVENVIRHYDTTGKCCPAPYVHDESLWQAFKARLTGTNSSTGGVSKDETIVKVPTNKDNGTVTPGKIDVKYQVFTDKWYPNVVNLEDYAGVENRPITAIYANTVGSVQTAGQLMYRAHLLGNSQNNWLPWVTDREDYAGVKGRKIDCVQFKLKGVNGKEAKYRVSPVGSTSYYPWVTGTSDYAGIYGKAIDKLQVVIE